MNHDTVLTDLIGSLSKSEKRYVRLYMEKNRIGETNHYLKLFDLITKAGTTDRNTIARLYGNDQFMRSQYRAYKHLLYKQLLKALSAYHSGNSIDDELWELLRQSKILFDKALYNQAESLLKKAAEIAQKYQKYSQLTAIIYWQKKVIHSSSIYTKTSKEEVLRMAEAEREVLSRIDNANTYWQLASFMFITYRIHGEVRTAEDFKPYDSILSEPALQHPDGAMSYQAKRDFFSTYINYYTATNQFEKAQATAKEWLNVLEAYPDQISDDPISYAIALYNLAYTSKELKKYKDFFTVIPKLKAMLGKPGARMNEHTRAMILVSSCNLELSGFIEIGEFKKAASLLPEARAVLKEQRGVNQLFGTFITMNSCLIHFVNGFYREALAELNETLTDKKSIVRRDHYSFIRVLELIIHFESGNADLLPYLVRSVYRSLLRSKTLHKMEKALLHFIRVRLHAIRTKKDQLRAFELLKEELTEICKDPLEAKFLDMFDLIAWLESKIRDRPLEEIVKEKVAPYLCP